MIPRNQRITRPGSTPIAKWKTAWKTAAAVVLTCVVVTVAAVVPHAGRALVVSRPLAEVDAIVSLASHEWERLPMTARRATAFPQSTVLLTLPQPATAHNCHDCSGRLDRLRHLGVDPARVQVLPLRSGGTHGEALAVAAFARAVGIRRLLVVTSPYHTRRSLAVFEAVFQGSGTRIGIEPATDTSPANPPRWWRTPYDRAYVAYEWAAVVYYAFRYRVPVLER